MATLTIRDLPDELMTRIRTLSSRDRRSINKEFLVIIEEGLSSHTSAEHRGLTTSPISSDLQLGLWADLAGEWKDSRSTKETIDDIRRHRTMGREVRL